MLTRQSGDVAARSRKTRNDAGADRISRSREHDRDHRCRLLGRERRESVVRHDNIDLKPDELGGDLGKSLAASLGPAMLDCEIAAVAPPQFPQSPDKGSGPFALCRCRTGAQQANDCWLALLRPRRERPSHRHAAEQRDEFATAAHSITSSARASKVGGTSRPRAFAVFRLITVSYLVGVCTGRSAGFSPFKIRSI